MNQLSPIFAALGDPTRFAIVDRLLREGELSAGEIAETAPISSPAFSRHLKVLRGAGLLEQRVDRQRRLYSVRPEAVQRISAWTLTMRGDDTGSLHKVSGDIIEYSPPHRLRYSWAWYDDDDVRGHESEVSFLIEPDGDGVRLTMCHSGLEDEESFEAHQDGWQSTFTKLDGIFA